MRSGPIQELARLDAEIAKAEGKNPSSASVRKLRERRLALLDEISTVGERAMFMSGVQHVGMRMLGKTAESFKKGGPEQQSLLQTAVDTLRGPKRRLGEDLAVAKSAATLKPNKELTRELLDANIGDVQVSTNSNLEGATVLVRYDPHTREVRVEAGETASATDIRLHVKTVKTLRKYKGTFGRVRVMGSRVRQLLTGHPAYGTAGFEARLEVKKLKGILEHIEASEGFLQSRALAYSNDPKLASKAAEAKELDRRVADIQQQLNEHKTRLDDYEAGNLWVAAIDNTLVDTLKKPWHGAKNFAALDGAKVFGEPLSGVESVLKGMGYGIDGNNITRSSPDDVELVVLSTRVYPRSKTAPVATVMAPKGYPGLPPDHIWVVDTGGNVVPQHKDGPDKTRFAVLSKRGTFKLVPLNKRAPKKKADGATPIAVPPAVQLRVDALPKGLKVKLNEIAASGTMDLATFSRTVDLTERLARTEVTSDSVLKALGGAHRAKGAEAQAQALAEMQHGVDMLESGRIMKGSKAHIGAEDKGRLIDLGSAGGVDRKVELKPVPEADLVFVAPDGTVHVHEVKLTVAALIAKQDRGLKKAGGDFTKTQAGRAKQWEVAEGGKHEIHVKDPNDCLRLFTKTGEKVLKTLAAEGVEVWLGNERFDSGRMKKLAVRVISATPGDRPSGSTVQDLVKWLDSP